MRPPRQPKIGPWLVALLVLVLVGLGGAYVLTRDDDSETDAATVPEVVGLSLPEAVRRIEAADLRSRTSRVRTTRPAGRVFLQRPGAGSEVEPGSVVVLAVSRGPGRVEVPRLIGLSEAAAAERLARRRLDARVVRVASRRPIGTVVAQNPASGERVERGFTVRINVSRGRAARRTTTTTTTTTTTGTTTTTTTTTAPRMTTTQRTRTRPPAIVSVPDVVGLDAPTAEQRLRETGFGVRTASRDTTDPAEDGIVLEQRPAGGARAPRGSQVTMTVGALTP